MFGALSFTLKEKRAGGYIGHLIMWQRRWKLFSLLIKKHFFIVSIFGMDEKIVHHNKIKSSTVIAVQK